MMENLDLYDICIDGDNAAGHTYLLGNRAGFVLYLPAARNRRDRTSHAIKWFGASSFGRAFFEGFQLWVEYDGQQIELSRLNQTAFVMGLDAATHVYRVGDREIRERYFVPDGLQGFVMTVETDLPVIVKPEFDMRFYQSFNTDFSEYRSHVTSRGLAVSNRVHDAGSMHETLDFFGLAGAVHPSARVEMLPVEQHLVTKTYLKDERREKMIERVYQETQERSPDEAPIWDQYSTRVFAPALFHFSGPAGFACAFGDTPDEAEDGFDRLQANVPALREAKRHVIEELLESADFRTGNAHVDLAYAHVVTRFNDALVARDATLHVAPQHRGHYYAIFAGDKYFMDAWKRDENISLDALLITNDFATARQILDNTWQFQDDRTGRLPHIIRAGEPLVYYSSDGTLWALHRLFEYTKRSGDRTLLQDKIPMVEHFFDASMNFVQRGLLPSGGIIDKSYLWETWEDTPYTPRDGYPVEIELLWLTVLSDFLPFVRDGNPSLADRMEAALQEGQASFHLFEHAGYLVDSLSYDWKQRRILTPNGHVAFGLGYPLSSDLARSMVTLAREQLAGHRGVRSLAPRDWPAVFPAAFLADPRNVHGKDMTSVGIFNYHRGIEWEWLNPFFVAGELRCGNAEHAVTSYVKGQVREAVSEVGIGGLSELHDWHGQVGADFQAWSMAGFIEAVHRFAGVEVDALKREISVRPCPPLEWPHLRCRSRVGNTRFTIEYARPSALIHELAIHLLDPIPPGHTLHVGLPLPRSARFRVAICNGTRLPADAWEYEDPCGAESNVWACTSLPIEGAVVLRAEIDAPTP
ncbi:MAG: hypothetical protein NVS4B2_07570 [Chloroflexota bacterium]